MDLIQEISSHTWIFLFNQGRNHRQTHVPCSPTCPSIDQSLLTSHPTPHAVMQVEVVLASINRVLDVPYSCVVLFKRNTVSPA